MKLAKPKPKKIVPRDKPKVASAAKSRKPTEFRDAVDELLKLAQKKFESSR